jgi:HEAT repeat protein
MMGGIGQRVRLGVPPIRVPLLAAIFIVSVFPGIASVDARQPAPVRYEDVARILRANPNATPKELAQAGAEIDRILVDLATLRTELTEIRIRAARALGGYPEKRARAVLTTLMVAPDELPEVRGAAMEGLARAFGGKVVTELRPYLKDASPVLRTSAARALALAGGDVARGILRDALEHEPVLEVRLAIDEAIKNIR